MLRLGVDIQPKGKGSRPLVSFDHVRCSGAAPRTASSQKDDNAQVAGDLEANVNAATGSVDELRGTEFIPKVM